MTKLASLLAVGSILSGCSLYFGDGDDAPGPYPGDPYPDPGDPHAPGEPCPGGGPLPGTCGESELHIFGVYETRSDHSGGVHPAATASSRSSGRAITRSCCRRTSPRTGTSSGRSA